LARVLAGIDDRIAEAIKDIIAHGLRIESKSVPGAANVVALGVLALVFLSVHLYELIVRVIELPKILLMLLINAWGRWYFGMGWTDFVDRNPVPSPPAPLKLFVLLVVAFLACPITLAVLGY
jgi:hypothetical protein